MVDLATVLASAAASFAGLMVTVVLERRQETLRRLGEAERACERLEERLRTAERTVAILGSQQALLDLFAEKEKGGRPPVGGR